MSAFRRELRHMWECFLLSGFITLAAWVIYTGVMAAVVAWR